MGLVFLLTDGLEVVSNYMFEYLPIFLRYLYQLRPAEYLDSAALR